MKFNISRFTVEAGQEVEIVFVNADEMPHNLLITQQGALEVGEPQGGGDDEGTRCVRPALRAEDAGSALRDDA